MNEKLSRNEISSFVGDVFPIWLISDEDLRDADVVWSIDGPSHFREYKNARGGISYGIIVTLDGEGDSVVSAEYKGKKYTATLHARKMKQSVADRLNYYVGDYHDHTTMDHEIDSFPKRTSELPADYLAFLRGEEILDFAVISDHSEILDARCFFDGFMTSENMPMKTVIFPGSESEITLIEHDRFGIPHKNSGEIVVTNSDNHSAALTYEEFCEDLSTSPFAVCILAHPQVIGPQQVLDEKNIGIWNFDLEQHNGEQFKSLIKGVEMGNGTSRASNIANEHVYSLALDAGFKVSTTCSSDNHNPPWGFYGFPGKTVIMAEEHSKEAFLDALLNQRFYCSDSGNVKLYCTVNGMSIPTTLKNTDEYAFHIELDYFREDKETIPYKCQLVSDGGRVLYEVCDIDFSSYDFKIKNTAARWFYLRFVDKNAKKTLSPPIFTGREPIKDTKSISPIDKTGFTAYDRVSGADAGILINGNPRESWVSEKQCAEIVIDMKEERAVSGLGHYPYFITKTQGRSESYDLARVANDYEVLVSLDGESFESVADGVVRVCGGEIVIRFEEKRARYILFRVKSTLGQYSEYPEFKDEPLGIGELTPFA